MSTISAFALALAALVLLGHPGHSASFLGGGRSGRPTTNQLRRSYAASKGARFGERGVRHDARTHKL